MGARVPDGGNRGPERSDRSPGGGVGTTPSLSEDEIRRLVAAARVGILGTIGEEGRPHLVPFTFALDRDVIYSAIDDKPKTSRSLKRLDNIRRDPRVTVLIDRYDDDWSKLWWCRIEGSARVLVGGAETTRAHAQLASKYEQYRSTPPAGPWIVIFVEALAGWAAIT